MNQPGWRRGLINEHSLAVCQQTINNIKRIRQSLVRKENMVKEKYWNKSSDSGQENQDRDNSSEVNREFDCLRLEN